MKLFFPHLLLYAMCAADFVNYSTPKKNIFFSAPEIIFTCLGLSLILLCLVCCFFAFLYSSTKKSKRSRSIVTPAPIVYKPAEQPIESPKIVVKSTKLPPPALRIETSPQMLAQNAVAIDSDHATDHFLREMSRANEHRSRLLKDEFEVLSKTEARRTTKTNRLAARNPEANRYSDIIPYDQTIVELHRDHYINANFVQGENDAHRFIATQAPIGAEENLGHKVSTIADFWLMIYQYQVDCIVMLTDLTEHFVQKSSQYWPKSIGSSIDYDGVRVRFVAESEIDRVVHREFDVSSSSSTSSNSARRLSHFQYRNWRDDDAPDTTSFLDFLLRIRRYRFSSPIVVHCSAGIGRSGVFICTDNIISRIENEGIIDVFSEVNRARQQRPRMVHTLVQYESIYDIIALYLSRQQKNNNY